ncbi:hypothetical protein [Massilia sp. S19_KUP03_FR1]|uniref:hypothetical protein n=1 Tax=Massilia sp. S19_KUP03_FR1 TaxID=3025503 RepID=UPI002FCDDB3C
MTPRIVYLATADARGHLMRAQLLVHALRQAGAQVDVITTSDAGQRFLAGFGIEASILSHHYAMQFDTRQNMLRGASNRNVLHYMVHPARMLRDLLRLRRTLRGKDILVNDSFHPAALFMGILPVARRKVVHVYGGSLREAVLGNFDGTKRRLFSHLFRHVVGWQIDAARARLEHDFSYAISDHAKGRDCSLPTPVQVAGPPPADGLNSAAIYLNPHFSDTNLAHALCEGIADAGLAAYCVGEGYAGNDGWVGVDPNWASRAAHAEVIVSAPGMAALSIAVVYGRPIILVLTEQPEQASNAKRATALGIAHQTVTWRGEAHDFRCQVRQAASTLRRMVPAPTAVSSGRLQAQARVDAWTVRLLALCGVQT